MKKAARSGDSRLSKKQTNMLASKAVPLKGISSLVDQKAAATAKKTNAEVQHDFDLATQLKYPHFSWIPPEWDGGKPELEDTVTDEPTFTLENHPLNCVIKLQDRIEALRENHEDQLEFVEADRAVEALANIDPTDPLVDMPHPESDVSHVDPVVPSSDKKEIGAAIDRLEELKGKASRDGELKDAFQEALVPLRKAKAMLTEDASDPKKKPKGMQRLRLRFEYMLCHATTLFGEINDALKGSGDEGKYTTARNNYLALLADLDDSEPTAITPGERGYGLRVKWHYVYPLIFDGKIQGAKVVAKWNPHESSSGIPIPHD